MGQLVERWLTMREVRDPVLVEISFGSVGRAVAYNAEVPGSEVEHCLLFK